MMLHGLSSWGPLGCGAGVESRLQEAWRFGKPLACRPLLPMDMADRPFLMQGSAGHFYPIHAYVSIMLTLIRQAHPRVTPPNYLNDYMYIPWYKFNW